MTARPQEKWSTETSRIGPALPAFVSPTVLNVLVEKFGLPPIIIPDASLKALAG